MFKYAQILHNKVHWVFSSNETLDEMYSHRFYRNLLFVDITSKPEVQEGWNYDGTIFNRPLIELTHEEKIAAIRRQRDQLLATSDKYMLSDYPITDANREKWQEYRQALRDIPETCDVDNPVWPIKPQ